MVYLLKHYTRNCLAINKTNKTNKMGKNRKILDYTTKIKSIKEIEDDKVEIRLTMCKNSWKNINEKLEEDSLKRLVIMAM